jgi:preprotein translocase subunit YajC
MRFALALTASTLFLAPAAAMAQAAPAAPAAPAAGAPTVGTTVLDSTGATIGTVAAVSPSAIVIDTGTNKVPVPPTSVGKDAKGNWSMAMTKAALDAAAQQAQAQGAQQLQAALTPGAQIHSTDGAVVGTVKASDAQYVTVTTAKSGADVKLPMNGFSAGANGVVVGFTQAQFEAATAGVPAPAAGAAPAAPGGK